MRAVPSFSPKMSQWRPLVKSTSKRSSWTGERCLAAAILFLASWQ